MARIWIGLLLLACAAPGADPYVTSSAAPAAGEEHAITELRPVQRPGRYHYVRAQDGQYVLTDYWWEEVEVGRRVFRPGTPPEHDLSRVIYHVSLPAAGQPHSATAPDRGGVGIGRGTIGADDGRITRFGEAVRVEIVGGRARVEDQRIRLRPADFHIYEGERRRVRVQLRDDTFIDIVATFDGHGVDLGTARVARVDPAFDGLPQDLGDSPNVEKLEVVIHLAPSGSTPGHPSWNTESAEPQESWREPSSREETREGDGRTIRRQTIRYKRE